MSLASVIYIFAVFSSLWFAISLEGNNFRKFKNMESNKNWRILVYTMVRGAKSWTDCACNLSWDLKGSRRKLNLEMYHVFWSLLGVEAHRMFTGDIYWCWLEQVRVTQRKNSPHNLKECFKNAQPEQGPTELYLFVSFWTCPLNRCNQKSL